ncbi:MAG: type II toxin-antitoxin system VapC family toxin [Dehalococcoidia bacterium]
MTLVADASFVASALTEIEVDGQWARTILTQEAVAAPYLLLAESANVLRVAIRTGRLTEVGASRAYADLLQIPITLYSYEALAGRIWQLRNNIAPTTPGMSPSPSPRRPSRHARSAPRARARRSLRVPHAARLSFGPASSSAPHPFADAASRNARIVGRIAARSENAEGCVAPGSDTNWLLGRSRKLL